MLNLIRHATTATDVPLAPQPDNLSEQLKAIGF
jgi:hypothetical protein